MPYQAPQPVELYVGNRPVHIPSYSHPDSHGLQQDLQPIHPEQEVPDPYKSSLSFQVQFRS